MYKHIKGYGSTSRQAYMAGFILSVGALCAVLFFLLIAAAFRMNIKTDPAPSAPRAGLPRPVGPDDHIRGNINAGVKIVEYSDLECPFCKQFHGTLQEVTASLPGKVAWVYRHFPIDGLHPKARKEAEATECAAELGGNQVFWDYLDKIFALTPSNNRLEDKALSDIAEQVGLEPNEFAECLESGRHAERVERDVQDAARAGGRGTPYTVVVAENGQTFPISGALPVASVRTVVERAIEAN